MERLKINNLGMKILSVAIAVLIWFLVASIEDPVMTRRISGIPVTVKNEEQLKAKGYSYEIIQGEEVNIQVRGSKSVVRNLTAADFNAVADLNELSIMNAMPIHVTAKNNNDKMEISLGSVSTMIVKTDKLAEMSVVVNIEVDGEPAEGYAVGDMQAKPNLITVEGPKNLLNSLKEFLVVVDVEGASDTVEVSAVPELYDSEGERVTSKQLTYDVSTVDASVEIWKTKTVDLELAYEGEPAKGYELVSFDYEPKQLTVTASEDILEDLEKITLPSISIEGRIENYEKDIEITRDLLPEGVENADPDAKDVKAQATIEEIKSQTIPFTSGSITVRGNDQNYNIAYDAGNDYELVVYCTDSRKKKLTILDFAPWIDVTDLGAGTHTLRVRVKDVEGVTVEKTPKISIMLTEK